MQRATRLGRLAACATLALLPGRALAGAAFQTGEQGTFDMGRAVVGAAVAADSAATAFFNPAAMTKLDKPQAVGGLMSVLGDIRFEADANTTFGGGNGGQAASDVLVPTGPFYVHPLNERWRAGFSVTAPAVGTLSYDRTWAGRYIVTEISFLALAITPALAYKVSDELSLGFVSALESAKRDLYLFY